MKPIIISILFLVKGEIQTERFEIFESCESWFHHNVRVTEQKKTFWSGHYYHDYKGKKVIGYICDGEEPQ